MSTTGFTLSFVAVATAVELFTLQVPASIVDAGDFYAKAVNAPADTPPTTTRWLTLFALKEALLVTVGDVQRESQNPRSVLHALNEIIQPPPARSKLRLQFVEAQRCEVQGAGLSQSCKLLLAVLGLLHGLGLPTADVVSSVYGHLSLREQGLWDGEQGIIVIVTIF